MLFIHSRRWQFVAVLGIVVSSSGAVGSFKLEQVQGPRVLDVPDGQAFFFAAHARGVQIYESQKGGIPNTYAWALKGPEANLFDNGGKRIGKHFAGPTWETRDGSKVVGKRVVSVDSPRAGDIPWLLLKSESASTGRMSEVSYVMRVDTFGGLAPAEAPAKERQEARVKYEATYLFFTPAKYSESVVSLARALTDRSEAIRTKARATFDETGKDAEPVIRALADMFFTEDKAYIRQGAYTSLFGLGEKAAPAVPALMAALSQISVETRGFACSLLGRIGARAAPAIPMLVAAIDQGGYVKRCAVDSLALFGDLAAPAIPKLIEVVKREGPGYYGGGSAIVALSKMGLPASLAVPIFVDLMLDSKANPKSQYIPGIGPSYLEAISELSDGIVERSKEADFTSLRAASKRWAVARRSLQAIAADAMPNGSAGKILWIKVENALRDLRTAQDRLISSAQRDVSPWEEIR
jgi:hypothetical protein